MEKFPTELYRIHAIRIPQNDRYRMHAIRIPQSAYIQLWSEFIALSQDKKAYSLLKNEDLINYKHTGHCKICHYYQLIYNSSNDECEYILLYQPNAKPVSKLLIHIIPIHKDHWIHLSSKNGWLFSLRNPATLQIIGPGKQSELVTVKGWGTINLKSLCTGPINKLTLTGMQDLGKTQEFLYLPRVSLNTSQYPYKRNMTDLWTSKEK